MKTSVYPASRLIRHLMTFCVSLLPTIFAVGAPPPVNVNQPVQIIGVVETINDVLRTPYAVSKSQTLNSGATQVFLDFDVPAGKRLVVEMVAIEASHLPTDYVWLDLQTVASDDPLSGCPTPLAFTDTRNNSAGIAISVATHPITVRVNGRTGGLAALRFVGAKTSSAGSFRFSATVRGYTVDIPVQ
jgi:hypothetical protein